MGTVFATSVLVGLWLKEKDVKEVRSKVIKERYIHMCHFHCPLIVSLWVCAAPDNATRCGDFFCLFGGTCNMDKNICQCVPPFYGEYCANSTGEDGPTQSMYRVLCT